MEHKSFNSTILYPLSYEVWILAISGMMIMSKKKEEKRKELKVGKKNYILHIYVLVCLIGTEYTLPISE